MNYNNNQEKIGIAGIVCIGVSVLIAGYILQKAEPYIHKIHNKIFHPNNIESKFEVKEVWHNVKDDLCLKGKH